MKCQRCEIEHGQPFKGIHDAYHLADIQDGFCQACDYESAYTAFLYLRAGVDAHADSYGVADDYKDTMFGGVTKH